MSESEEEPEAQNRRVKDGQMRADEKEHVS